MNARKKEYHFFTNKLVAPKNASVMTRMVVEYTKVVYGMNYRMSSHENSFQAVLFAGTSSCCRKSSDNKEETYEMMNLQKDRRRDSTQIELEILEAVLHAGMTGYSINRLMTMTGLSRDLLLSYLEKLKPLVAVAEIDNSKNNRDWGRPPEKLVFSNSRLSDYINIWRSFKKMREMVRYIPKNDCEEELVNTKMLNFHADVCLLEKKYIKAHIIFKKVLEINPRDSYALKGKQELEKLCQKEY